MRYEFFRRYKGNPVGMSIVDGWITLTTFQYEALFSTFQYPTLKELEELLRSDQ